NALLVHLNENTGATSFADTSGSGNNGSCSGSSCPTAGGAGKFNKTVTVAGRNHFINLGHAAAPNIRGPSRLETEATPAPLSGIPNVLAHGPANSPSGEIFLRINNGNYEVGSYDGTAHAASSPAAATDVGNWVHLAGVYDGTMWRLYVNGTQAATISTTVGAM